jgi:hypothetical protein
MKKTAKKGGSQKNNATPSEPAPQPKQQQQPTHTPVTNSVATMTIDELLSDISSVQDEVITPEMEEIAFNVGEVGLVGEGFVYLNDARTKNISGSTVI